jgi:hypothetical protein
LFFAIPEFCIQAVAIAFPPRWRVSRSNPDIREHFCVFELKQHQTGGISMSPRDGYVQ